MDYKIHVKNILLPLFRFKKYTNNKTNEGNESGKKSSEFHSFILYKNLFRCSFMKKRVPTLMQQIRMEKWYEWKKRLLINYSEWYSVSFSVG